jgi:raffinose/stachyose/melibiose transport system substrate-binding protein
VFFSIKGMIYSIYTSRLKRYSYKHKKEKEKNKMKKSLSLCALSLVLAVSLSACGSKSGNPVPSASGTQQKQSDSKEQKTLTVVTWGGEGYLPKVSDAFTKEHPNVKVDFQKIATDYDSILRSKINAGTVV